jgi:hypothetical protein
LLRWHDYIAWYDVELYGHAWRDQRCVRFLSDKTSDRVDRCATQPSFVAQQIVDGGDGLDSADRLTKVY